MKRAIHSLLKTFGYRVVRIEDGAAAGARASEPIWTWRERNSAFSTVPRKMLESLSRPAILAEVQDMRRRPWGYPAREIVQFLASAGYRWFALNQAGDLQPVSSDLSLYDANLVALPRERTEESSTMACLKAAAKTT
jgi:hypothetical protein